MRLYLYSLLIFVALISYWAVSGCAASDSDSTEPETKSYVSVFLKVSGNIQADDPWTTGATAVNEWAKPMYRIWFDMNGNANDGPYGNGEGPKQCEIWLDTGRLGFLWYGPDNTYSTADDIKYWPLFTITNSKQTANNIEASLGDNGSMLSVSFPLEMIGNPAQIEIAFMASSWTSSACDNLGQGANTTPCWISVNTATPNSYSVIDNAGDMEWPVGLIPDRSANFDIVSVGITISKK